MSVKGVKFFRKWLEERIDEAEEEVEELRGASGSSGNLMVAEAELEILAEVLENFNEALK